MRPSRTSEIAPSSSEMTTTIASVSSVKPMAARCRVPSVLLTCGFVVRGRKQPAAMIRPLCMISAPSWIGEVGRKMLVISSLLTCASSRTPTSMYWLRPTSRCKTMSAPMRLLASATAARTISSRSCPLQAAVAPEERARSHLRQGATDVVLEDDDDDQQDGAEEVVENPIEGVEVEVLGRQVGQEHHRQPDQHLHRAGAADEVDDAVDDERDERDVDRILQAEIGEQLEHGGADGAALGVLAHHPSDPSVPRRPQGLAGSAVGRYPPAAGLRRARRRPSPPTDAVSARTGG